MAFHDCWELTWDELLQIAEKGSETVNAWEGYVICSPYHSQFNERQAREYYVRSLQTAVERGVSLRDEVMGHAIESGILSQDNKEEHLGEQTEQTQEEFALAHMRRL